MAEQKKTATGRKIEVSQDEKNVSAFEPPPQTPHRILRPHGDPRGPSGHQAPPSERARQAHGLTPDLVRLQREDRGRRLSLKKSDKLVRKSQFDQVRRDGRKSAGPGLVAVVAPCDEPGCGVICSKKFSLLAVERNRARRLLWESFRHLKAHLPPCRLVLIPRQKLKKYKMGDALAELAGLLAQQGVIPADVADSFRGRSSDASGSTRS